MSSLEKYEPPQIAELDEWAKKLHESGMFTDVKSVAQAFVKIAAGAEMGLTPFQSITGVHFIQNKPVVGAGLLASMLDRAPYNYTVEWSPSIEAPEACTITVFKHGVERGQSRFSMQDAQRAGLVKAGGNWQKYPTDMLFARAVSQAARRYAPGAMGTTFYVEAHGEMEIQPDTPNGAAVAKPRTRVTAEVIQDAHVVPDDDPVTIPTVPAGELRKALAALNPHQRDVLFGECGIDTSASIPLKDIRAALTEKWSELGLDPFEGEPVPVTLLGAIYTKRTLNAPADAADEFQHFAETGQDLDADPQTAIA